MAMAPAVLANRVIATATVASTFSILLPVPVSVSLFSVYLPLSVFALLVPVFSVSLSTVSLAAAAFAFFGRALAVVARHVSVPRSDGLSCVCQRPLDRLLICGVEWVLVATEVVDGRR